jgi:hypothetical protein
MRLRPIALTLAVGALASGAEAAAPPAQLAELPGARTLPPVPPLAPPQPPLAEIPRLRGTVAAGQRVVVGIDADGTPSRVRVVQRLTVRALGDYTFLIPAPAVSVVAAPGSESQPGLRPNQIVWQGFSPRRKVLAATADLRLGEAVGALPLRVRVSGMPSRPGPFELVLSIENATRTRAQAFSASAEEGDVADALAALRAFASLHRRVEDRTIRISGRSRPANVEAWAPFDVRASVAFPPGTVRELRHTRFTRLLDRETLRVTLEGVALRAASPKVRITAIPSAADAIPASARTLDALVAAYVRYARTLQYRSFLANPDPLGPSATTYVYETAAMERPTLRTRTDREDDSGVPAVILLGGVVLLGLGLAVVWAHS